MPKLKTHRAAAKRFSLTKNGKVKRGSAYRSHILTEDNKEKKRIKKNRVCISCKRKGNQKVDSLQIITIRKYRR